MLRLQQVFASGLLLAWGVCFARAQAVNVCGAEPGASAAPRICKVDPPNWWASMPAPMLLVYGEGLGAATFKLSDARLQIREVKASANGHYAQLWLSANAAHPETIQITATSAAGSTKIDYTFARRRGASDGFAGFSSKDVMYLIMTDRFADGNASNNGPDHAAERARPRGWHGGDLQGIVQHLDYLQQLGITTVWITPVVENHESQSYHGYGATDLYRVDEHFGSLADLQQLALELHKRQMKLVLDLVPNHVGPKHPWVLDSPDPTWFHGTLANHTRAQGEFLPLTDPHAPWRDQRNVTLGWFASALPDLNQDDPSVARYLIQNAEWWVEQAGVDGLRLDTFPYVERAFWHQFHAELHAMYPKLTTVGEVFNGDPAITSTFAGGVTRTGLDTGLDTPFDFPTYFKLRNVFLKGESMKELADVLRLDNLFPHPERLVPFLGNHDTSRFMNHPGATLAKLHLAFTVLTTMRGMPQIYSGDEIAMRGGEDPDDRQDFPGGFAGSGPGAFDAAGRTVEQAAAFASLADLLRLRAAYPALQTGAEQVLSVSDDVMVYVRTLGAQRILVAVNKASAAAQDVDVATEATAVASVTKAQVLLPSGAGAPAQASIVIQPGTLQIHLGAETAAIFNLQ